MALGGTRGGMEAVFEVYGRVCRVGVLQVRWEKEETKRKTSRRQENSKCSCGSEHREQHIQTASRSSAREWKEQQATLGGGRMMDRKDIRFPSFSRVDVDATRFLLASASSSSSVGCSDAVSRRSCLTVQKTAKKRVEMKRRNGIDGQITVLCAGSRPSCLAREACEDLVTAMKPLKR
jgi:hypothetical protein